ncbi:protein of unknown function [Rhodovastum atsumiense]|nr:protein of unknown function [Rhodovastum atsumiense]
MPSATPVSKARSCCCRRPTKRCTAPRMAAATGWKPQERSGADRERSALACYHPGEREGADRSASGQRNAKTRPAVTGGRASLQMRAAGLTGRPGSLDLGFLEQDVLARDRIVFAELELARLGARVLLRDVEVPGVGGRHQLDLDSVRLRHGR